MTAEKLHDAIGLLPADLIAEADKRRQKKPAARPFPWKRYAAMAACFVLVLSCARFAALVFAPKGGSSESIAELSKDAAPMEQAPAAVEEPAAADPEALPEEAGNSVTGSGSTTEDAVCELPRADEPEGYAIYDPMGFMTPMLYDLCINSRQSTLLTSQEALEKYLLGVQDLSYAAESLQVYDDAWFETHDLLVLQLPAEKSEFRYTVSSLTQPDDRWILTLQEESTPEDNTPDPVLWFLFVGVDTGLLSPEDSVSAVVDAPNT